MKATKENAKKAKEWLEDQGCFISEEALDFLTRFINSCIRALPKDGDGDMVVTHKAVDKQGVTVAEMRARRTDVSGE